jgi:AAA family ATP:ADP antiporter
MLSSLRRTLWGDFSPVEVRHFGVLSVVFFFVVGAYWMLRELKNALFLKLVGPAGLPYAKMISIASLVLLMLFYNKLVDWLEKTSLIYVVTATYGFAFLLIAYALGCPDLAGPGLGWLLYILIESFGSIVVSLFWSYVASVTETNSAKRGYPLMVSGAQLGAMLGSAAVLLLASVIGDQGLFLIAASSIFMVPALIYYFHKFHAPTQLEKIETKNPSTGVLEGLRLIAKHPYLMGVLVVSTVYEVVCTIFDFLMSTAAHDTLGTGHALTQFMGVYGLAVNGISFLFALIGTSFLMRRFGLSICLMLYPALVALLVLGVMTIPGLWMFFVAEVCMKAFSYALNNPCKEMMYLPTSKDVKFKAKGWIDVQGARTAKGLGSGIFAIVPAFASIISLGVIALWMPIAYWVGNKNKVLVDNDLIIK